MASAPVERRREVVAYVGGVLNDVQRVRANRKPPQRDNDRTTFEDPLQFPVGVRDVMVGGEWVVRDGEMTGARPGRLVPGRR